MASIILNHNGNDIPYDDVHLMYIIRCVHNVTDILYSVDMHLIENENENANANQNPLPGPITTEHMKSIESYLIS